MSLSVFISSNEAGVTKFPLKRARINFVKSSGVEIIPPEEKAMSRLIKAIENPFLIR